MGAYSRSEQGRRRLYPDSGSALDKARFGRIVTRSCHFPAFDACWINHSETPDPLAVAQCPVVPVPFRE
ncbi:hypothetical protein [Thermomonas carbonis]|uniref:Uncharacterized protein n=1 Tax=Thermomonas carbonis TaxID=1463158 RepID=A0A7G9SPK7_9GAMM|nr:hypothetical protein [Thermomonas carbonis]QNN69782.1 hypothetical protein H9L16_14185 [Thermomonas carbonis]